jgi:hypothetical protein
MLRVKLNKLLDIRLNSFIEALLVLYKKYGAHADKGKCTLSYDTNDDLNGE